jgi:hypothetical protein
MAVTFQQCYGNSLILLAHCVGSALSGSLAVNVQQFIRLLAQGQMTFFYCVVVNGDVWIVQVRTPTQSLANTTQSERYEKRSYLHCIGKAILN